MLVAELVAMGVPSARSPTSTSHTCCSFSLLCARRSSRQVQWVCSAHSPPHTWTASILSRSRPDDPTGCPKCGNTRRQGTRTGDSLQAGDDCRSECGPCWHARPCLALVANVRLCTYCSACTGSSVSDKEPAIAGRLLPGTWWVAIKGCAKPGSCGSCWVSEGSMQPLGTHGISHDECTSGACTVRDEDQLQEGAFNIWLCCRTAQPGRGSSRCSCRLASHPQ